MHRSALSFLACSILAAPAAAQMLEIHTLDIGRGDCALILSPSGTRVLIDTGKPGDGNAIVIPYLQSLGVTDLDYILISHYDGDHIGGVPELMAAGYSPIAVYDRGDLDAEMHPTWQAYVNAIGSLRQQITVGMLLDLGGGVTLRNWIVNGMIWTGPTIGVVGKVENAKSAGWKLEFGNFDYGTFGDIGGTFETPLGPLVGDLDVYKASHHGSNTSSVAAFIAAVKPDVTFVSSGSDSSNPKQATIDIINTAAAMRWIYMTNDSSLLTRGGRPAYDHMILETNGYTYTIDGVTIPRQTFLCDELAGGAAAVGDIALSEFLPDPSAVSDAEGEYIEITNLTDKWLSMKDWTLRDLGNESAKIASNAQLAPRQTLLVAAQGDIGRNGGIQPGLVWPRDKFELDNGVADAIIVEDAGGTRLIDVQHGVLVLPGQSLERMNLYDPAVHGNFAAGIVPFGSGDLGTPGSRNSADTTPWVPILEDVTPAIAFAPGGSWVTLSGFDLAVDTPPDVFFARRRALDVEVVDVNTVRALVPPLVKSPTALGFMLSSGLAEITEDGLAVRVTVVTAGGHSSLAGALTYTPLVKTPQAVVK